MTLPDPEDNSKPGASRPKERLRAIPYKTIDLTSGRLFAVSAKVVGTLEWHHLITPCSRPADGRMAICSGSTVWVARLDANEIASLAWEWALIDPPGAVAMADVLAIETNLHLRGPDGAALSSGERAAFLARIVAKLPWHEVVLARLEEFRASGWVIGR